MNSWQRKQAERSINKDGYKVVRVVVFGEELCEKMMKRMGFPGVVVGLRDMKALDYSEQSGQSYRIENEGQVVALGKAEELTFCKGIKK